MIADVWHCQLACPSLEISSAGTSTVALITSKNDSASCLQGCYKGDCGAGTDNYLALATCDERLSQLWVMSTVNRQLVNIASGYCLSVTSEDVVVMAACGSNSPAQTWALYANDTLEPQSDLGSFLSLCTPGSVGCNSKIMELISNDGQMVTIANNTLEAAMLGSWEEATPSESHATMHLYLQKTAHNHQVPYISSKGVWLGMCRVVSVFGTCFAVAAVGAVCLLQIAQCHFTPQFDIASTAAALHCHAHCKRYAAASHTVRAVPVSACSSLLVLAYLSPILNAGLNGSLMQSFFGSTGTANASFSAAVSASTPWCMQRCSSSDCGDASLDASIVVSSICDERLGQMWYNDSSMIRSRLNDECITICGISAAEASISQGNISLAASCSGKGSDYYNIETRACNGAANQVWSWTVTPIGSVLFNKYTDQAVTVCSDLEPWCGFLLLLTFDGSWSARRLTGVQPPTNISAVTPFQTFYGAALTKTEASTPEADCMISSFSHPASHLLTFITLLNSHKKLHAVHAGSTSVHGKHHSLLTVQV